MAFFDLNLNNQSSTESILASIDSRLNAQDIGTQMMAMSDLSSVAASAYKETSAVNFKRLVALAADSLTENPNRSVAGHGAGVFTSSSVAAREFLPQLLRFLEHGFPGRDEPGLRVVVMNAVGGAGIASNEVKRVLELFAARDPVACRDDVFFAKEALKKLGLT